MQRERDNKPPRSQRTKENEGERERRESSNTDHLPLLHMYSRFIIVARLAPSYFCFLSSSLSVLIHRSCSSNDALPVCIDVSQETSEENKKRKRTTRRVKEKIII